MLQSQADEIVRLLTSIDKRLETVQISWAHPPIFTESGPPYVVGSPSSRIVNLPSRRMQPNSAGGLGPLPEPPGAA